LLYWLFAFFSSSANVRLPKIFGNGMVLQKPVAVRFGWADDAGDNNLFNKDGFSAVPFRTDQWKGITEGTKFRD
jgi:sialate O-acetylesterase